MAVKQAAAVKSPDFDFIGQPLQMRTDDLSGTPMALIEAARNGGRLELRDGVNRADVLIEFPFGPIPREQTGFSRFVRLTAGTYALVR
jgi:hypothetical protein